jgi:hypothetical protein
MYLAIDHLDLSFAVNTLARKASRPSQLDATKLKRTIRYLRGHQKVDWLFIMLEGIFPAVLEVFVDADWGGDVLTRKSTAGGLAVWGICTLAGWAKLEAVIALSSAESEYYGMVSGVQRALAIQSLLSEFNIPVSLEIKTDSQAAKQSVEKVGLLHVKHMAMRMLFLKDLQRAGVITIVKIAGASNPADMFTKALSAADFEKCKNRIPGIYWGDTEAFEEEIQAIEIEESNQLERYSITAQVVDSVMGFMTWFGECARLGLACVGLFVILKRLVWQSAPTTPMRRNVATQSQCTYTSTRGVEQPRFLCLDSGRQGAFLD